MKTLLISMVFGLVLSTTVLGQTHALLIADNSFLKTNVVKNLVVIKRYPPTHAWVTNTNVIKQLSFKITFTNLNPTKVYLLLSSANNIDWTKSGMGAYREDYKTTESTNMWSFTTTILIPDGNSMGFYMLKEMSGWVPY